MKHLARIASACGVTAILWMAAPLRADVVVTVGPAMGAGPSWSVPVSIANVTDLFAYQFDFAFNPAVLQLVSVQEGPFLATAGGTSFFPGLIDNVNGTDQFIADSLAGFGPGASGGGVLATLNFQAVPGFSQLTVSNVTLLDSGFNEIPSTIVNSSVFTPEPAVPGWLAAGLCAAALVRLGYRRRPHGQP
jgi:general secretion pathway protein D